MNLETFKLDCSMVGELFDSEGKLKQKVEKHNMILNVGFDFICDRLGKGSSVPSSLSHIAIGTNSNTTTATMTGLQRELVRVAYVYTHTAGTKFFTVASTFGAGVGTGALCEAGICNASSGGITIDRVVFPVVNKGADDIFKVTFQFKLAEKEG